MFGVYVCVCLCVSVFFCVCFVYGSGCDVGRAGRRRAYNLFPRSHLALRINVYRASRGKRPIPIEALICKRVASVSSACGRVSRMKAPTGVVWIHFTYSGRCSVAQPSSPPLSFWEPKYAICAKEHTTGDHRCSVEGCRVGKGRMCSHTTAKCANCGGPHGARADACQAKRIAQHAARGWRSPSPPRRERRREAPGAEATTAQGEEQGEEQGEPAAEMKEMGGEEHGAMEE